MSSMQTTMWLSAESKSGKVMYLCESSTLKHCSLRSRNLNDVRNGEMLSGEVIYAYFVVASTLTENIVALDTTINMVNGKIPSYPLGAEKKAILGLHVNANHWVFTLFDIGSRRITCYDTNGHHYDYRIDGLAEATKSTLIKIWGQITNVPLNHMSVAGPASVHEQRDGVNCGVWACLYADRVCSNRPTKQESVVSQEMLQVIRMKICGVLTRFFYIDASNGDCENPSMIYLPRMTEYRIFDERRVVIDNGNGFVFHVGGVCEKQYLDKYGECLKKSSLLKNTRKRETSEQITLREFVLDVQETAAPSQPLFFPPHLLLGGCVKYRSMHDNVERKCSLLRSDLECLKGNFWLDDQTLFAYFLLITSLNRNIVALDPLIALIAQNYVDEKFSSYPLSTEKIAFLPLNVNTIHWMLAVFKMSNNTVKIYDSLAHRYDYGCIGLGSSVINTLKLVWTFITDLPLMQIEVAGENEVHEQMDNFNCGIYVCLYATRLCSNSITKSEPSLTAAQLMTYRRKIHEVLLSFYSLSDPNDEEQLNLPRMTEHNSFEEARLHISFRSAARNEVVAETDEFMVDVVKRIRLSTYNGLEMTECEERKPSEPSREEAVVNEADEYAIITKGVCAFLNRLFSGSRASPTTWCVTVFGHTIIYSNMHNRLAMCIVSRVSYTNTGDHRGEVFDDTVKVISRELRQFLKSVCEKYLFKKVRFGRYKKPQELEVKEDNTCFFVACHIARYLALDEAVCNDDYDLMDVLRNILQLSPDEILPEAKINSIIQHHCRVEGCHKRHTKRSTELKSFINAARRNDSLPDLYSIGEMECVCKYCNALYFKGEPKNLCCNGGINIVPETMFSCERDELLSWFWDMALSNEDMFQMIRPINNMLSVAGINIKLREFETRSGPVPLVLQGKYQMGICHLNPEENKKPCFAQLYLASDAKVQSAVDDNMKNWGVKVDVSIIKRLISTMKEHNALVRSYMTMFEVYEMAKSKFKEQGLDSVPQVVMNIKQRRDVPQKITENIHPGTLNAPIYENQIASIFLCKDGRMPTHEELDEGIVVYSRGTGGTVPHYSYNMDALSYVLFFPRGEQSFVKDSLPKATKVGRTKGSKKSSNKGSAIDENTVNDVDSSSDSDLSLNADQYIDDCDNEVDTQSEENSEQHAGMEKEVNGAEIKDKKKSSGPSKQQRKFLSRREFVLYIMARRKNVRRHRFLGTGKLCSQYIIHQYSRIEADRMAAIRRNCFELRSAKASTLYKYTDEKLREKGYKLGKLVTMPSNYVGSRRWCQKQYSKGMAIAQRLGKPDLFITFTGNSEWPEIKKNLPGKFDSWITDPFLCVRVFYMKLKQFLRDLKSGKIFGDVLAYQASVEFQKRGMPHAHILVTLADKITTAEEVDKCISATIPPFPVKGEKDYDAKKRLHEYVSKFMIHGPCAGREDLACRQRNPKLCEKRFPKQLRDTTEMSEDGYPLYKRPDDGRYVAVGRKKQTLASNADVVPYNSWLLARYNCHINVEICSSLRSYKYIYKYIYKGVDQILLELFTDEQLLRKNTRIDENGEKVVDIDMCEVYLRCRFLSHIEAAYRICGFPLQMSSHKVVFLTPHLENENLVYFCSGKEVKRDISDKSELLAYFKLCSVDESARNLTWVEVSEQYIYRRGVGLYEKRKKKGEVIGRINSISPKFSELYALRKMLLTRKGVTSFQNMRTVNGKVYRTYMEAARESGLIVDSNEWDSCLAVAVSTEMPFAIRRLFAQILMHCSPSDPLGLWNKYKSEMRVQAKESQPEKNENVLDIASLKHIEKILRANGSTLSECGLKSLELVLRNWERKHDAEIDDLNVFENEVNTGASGLSDLNSEQRNVVDVLLESALRDKSDRSRCFFVYGKAGCGKTFLFRRFIDVLQGLKKNVIAVASTGIAATLLQNGRTAHSVFRLPVNNLSFESTANVDASSLLAQRFRDTDVIIWDEISMQTRYAVECAEKMLRDVAAPDFRHTAFGGIMMVFGGDWAQFLPVVENGSKTEVLNETLKYSGIWKLTRVLTLEKNMRVLPGNESFTAWLRDVGEGNNFLIDNLIRIPSDMVMPNEQHVIDWLYTPEILNDKKRLANVALLSIRNTDVLSINDIIVEKLSGEYMDVHGVDEAVQEEDGIDGLPFDDEEDIHKETPTGMPPYLLRLKKGCILMLLRNIDITSQLCNGTRLQLDDVVYDEKHVPIILRCRNLITGNMCLIPRTPNVYENKVSGIAFKRFQFPFCEMRFIYRSMACSKDKELFKKYCLMVEKKKQEESAKEMKGCSKMYAEHRTSPQFWDDEKVIQWIMTGGLSPNAGSAIPEDENVLHEAQVVLDAITEKLDGTNKEEI
ncbi:Ulp1 protease family, catalytic domain protein [Ancylostoma duodenale]|uniref:ATP-dependent DNA helicase n=1 Tax=Ancylostoma duodenale TaxID=51022 RepID=A0A0C2D6C4_9BILA|nr:Ulp1 protease family, catalytic domain protein [Ancylostoma duodenale]